MKGNTLLDLILTQEDWSGVRRSRVALAAVIVRW